MSLASNVSILSKSLYCKSACWVAVYCSAGYVRVFVYVTFNGAKKRNNYLLFLKFPLLEQHWEVTSMLPAGARKHYPAGKYSTIQICEVS